MSWRPFSFWKNWWQPISGIISEPVASKYRLYREERLTVHKRGGRKRVLGTRAPMAIPQDPNQRWSLDFVSDMLVDGRRFRILCVIDDTGPNGFLKILRPQSSGVTSSFLGIVE